MSETMQIIRLAAKGDGVTQQGMHVSGALPGDTVDESGAILARGPHYQTPPCRHFGTCGGCQLQHATDEALTAFVRDRVVNAASGQGLTPLLELPTYLSPAATRRRATLHALRTHNGAVIGFREAGSHRIINCENCEVLHPKLTALIDPLRKLIAANGPKGVVDIQMTLCDQGADIGLTNFPLDGLAAIESIADFARSNALARLTADHGYGAEVRWEPDPVTVTLGGVAVAMPPGAFLQAANDAEQKMIGDAREMLKGKRLVADLFAGLGTFAFALQEGRKVLAAEADRAAHMACKTASGRGGKSAAGEVHALHRDLFRNPLTADEISRFDAVLLDPPRAGAKSQIGEIAQSTCDHVVYMSCNPSSWARDGARLAEAGFSLAKLRPVGQFRWSTHVELVSLFTR